MAKTRRDFLKTTLLAPFGLGIACKRYGPLNPNTSKSDQLELLDQSKDGTAVNAGYRNMVIPMKVTAYCPCKKCCGKWADVYPRRTASGHVIQDGDKFVAADGRFPFGTRMYVPEYCYHNTQGTLERFDYEFMGLVKVEDRGGAIKGNHIDVFFPTHQEALNWGVTYLFVTVYDFQGVKMR